MSFRWGNHRFQTLHDLRRFFEQFRKERFKITDEDGFRTIQGEKSGLLADIQKLHPVVQANGRVWYSSWYKPEYPYKKKTKTLKQRLAEVKELEPAE